LSPADVVDLVADLVAKSLVTADFTGNQVFYRLLDTTRAYAMEVLAESGELHALQHRHAAHFQTVFEAGEIEWLTEGGIDWLAAYAGDIDNVRAALDWAFGPDGDEATGVALTAASTPLWMHLSLVLELRGRIERALTSAEAARGQRQDMRLLTALGATLTYAPYQGRDGAAVWCNALALADALRDTDYRLRALWGQWIDRIKSDDFSAALDIAHRFQDLAGNLPEAPIGERMLGLSLFYLGELPRARHHLEHMLSQYAAPVNGSHVIRFQFDQRVSARTSLAQVLWLQGLPDQAANIVETDVPPALASGHGPTLCNALGHGAAAVALMRGDLDALDRHTAMLLDQSIRHGLPTLHAWGRCFEGALLIRRGEVLAGTGTLRSALDALSGGGFKRRSTRFQAEWAMGLGLAGDVPSGLAVIDETLARSEHSRERWYEPELLRIKGELLLIMDIPDVRAAENLFRRAIAVAVEQAALSWELRAASSLALLLHQHRGPTAARDVLQSVHGRFVEGFATADVLKAGALLKEFA
jgi:predicted ATPase